MAQRPNHEQLPDLDLASLTAAGDQQAFAALMRRHGPMVRGLVRRMGGQGATADDIAQDAFMAAYTSIGNYRGEGSFGGWVCRIAGRMYVRKARHELRYQLTDEPIETGEDEGPEPGLRMDLDAALATLSEAERVCVSLCSGAGYSHPEAAELLQIPLGTVKSHVKRGLDKLRRRLETGRQERANA
jgi:RNA polymerase sigma-70 factor (ECF subfamily)